MKLHNNLIKFCTILVIAGMIFVAPAFAQQPDKQKVTIEVSNVIKDGGTVHISVSLSSKSYKKKKPDIKKQVKPSGGTVTVEFDLPLSDCVINVYQDSDGNGELNTNWIGMPKEPVGISNWEGSGIPPGFDKLKIKVTEKTQKITVKLHKI